MRTMQKNGAKRQKETSGTNSILRFIIIGRPLACEATRVD